MIITEEVEETITITTTETTTMEKTSTTKPMMINMKINMTEITIEHKDLHMSKEEVAEAEDEAEEVEEAIRRVSTEVVMIILIIEVATIILLEVEAMIILLEEVEILLGVANLPASIEIINISRLNISKEKMINIQIHRMINTNTINNRPLQMLRINKQWMLDTKHTCLDSAQEFTAAKHKNQIKSMASLKIIK